MNRNKRLLLLILGIAGFLSISDAVCTAQEAMAIPAVITEEMETMPFPEIYMAGSVTVKTPAREQVAVEVVSHEEKEAMPSITIAVEERGEPVHREEVVPHSDSAGGGAPGRREAALQPGTPREEREKPAGMGEIIYDPGAGPGMGGGAPGGREVIYDPGADPEESAGDKALKIFCKILDHRLSEVLGDDYVSRSLISEGCKGYWLPPNDLLITLTVNFPVHLSTHVEFSRKEPVKETDLWQQYESQISERTEDRSPVKARVTLKVDMRKEQDRIEQLKKVVLDVMDKYTNRLKKNFVFDQYPHFGRLSILVNGRSGETPLEIRAIRVPDAPALEWPVEESMDEVKKILSLKQEQLALAEQELARLQQLKETGRISESEMVQAKEKLLERKMEMVDLEGKHDAISKRRAELETAKKQAEELAQAAKREKETELRELDLQSKIENQLKREPERLELQLDKGTESYPRIEMRRQPWPQNGDTTLIFQIEGEQATDTPEESIASKVKIVSY